MGRKQRDNRRDIWVLTLAKGLMEHDRADMFANDEPPFPSHIQLIGKQLYNKLNRLLGMYEQKANEEKAKIEEMLTPLDTKKYEVYGLRSAVDLIAIYQENTRNAQFTFMTWADITEVQDFYGFKGKELDLAEDIWKIFCEN